MNKSDSVQLHFRKFGEGVPLIVLHGLLGSLDNWQPLARRFAEHFQVFALDLRNHGLSPHHEDVSYEAMASDLEQFLRTQGLSGAHVLGHSMGGKVAMQFALRHPKQVIKLVAVDISPRAYPPRHKETIATLLSLDLHKYRRREELDAELARSVENTELRRFLLKNVGRDTHGHFCWKSNIRGLWQNYERLAVAVKSEVFCDRPALFIVGGKSRFVPAEDHKLIRRLFPRAEFCTIADAGHWVHVEEPDLVATKVLHFLRDKY